MKLDILNPNPSNVLPGGNTEWTPPTDWPDILGAGDNEIWLLVGDNAYPALKFTVVSSGVPYIVDWGDGTEPVQYNSEASASHKYIPATGTPCSEGYTTFLIKISSAGALTSFSLVKHDYANMTYQYWGILAANINAGSLVTGTNMFFNNNSHCPNLKWIKLAENMPNLATLDNAFKNSYVLEKVEIPDDLPNLTTLSSTFSGCSSLQSIVLPTADKLTSLVGTFQSCYSLKNVSFPQSYPLVTSVGSMFVNCNSIKELIFPDFLALTSISTNTIGTCRTLTYVEFGRMPLLSGITSFSECTSLKEIKFQPERVPITNASTNGFSKLHALERIVNIEYLGSVVASVNLSNTTFSEAVSLQYLHLTCLVGSLKLIGAKGYLTALSSVRILNPASPFDGTSPQIDIQYTSLSREALVTLFNDLPTLSGKTIVITGCLGTADLTADDRLIATSKGWTITG